MALARFHDLLPDAVYAHHLDGPRPEIVQVAGGRVIPRKFTQTPAGDEMPRDHRNVALACGALPNMLVVAG